MRGDGVHQKENMLPFDAAEMDDDDELQFVFTLSDGVQSVWHASMLTTDSDSVAMIIDVDRQKWLGGSKEGFVRLLECAEECFSCSDVYVCVSRSRSDLAGIMRTFMYLGFTPALPEHAPHNIDANTHALLVYNIE